MDKLDRIIKEKIEETPRRQKAKRGFWGKQNNIKTFCIISSENPLGRKIDLMENKVLYNNLIELLRNNQYIYFPVKGKYNNIEHLVMVYNISINDSENIGLKYNQESFIYATVLDDNLVNFSYYQKGETGNYAKIEDIQKYVDATDDDFTAIGRHFKFRIPFKIFEGQCRKINNIIKERCENDIYQRNYNKWINESISDEFTPHAQRIRRAKLWGTNYKMMMS